jgi:CRISPR-associated protein (TIGR03986 family)
MAWIKHKNPANSGRVSSAAYNFVELPDKIVEAVKSAENLPNHDTYSNSAFPNTGHFVVTLTTKTPLYVRCPLNPKENENKAHEVAGMDFTKKLGNKPDFFYTNEVKKEESATIPGSSLRGMLRNLLEIVSYSKISFVQDTPKMFYRAVAAPSNDSLGTFYKNKIKNLKAGYLKKDKNSWKIIPALIPRDVWDIPEKKPFLTIKDAFLQSKVSGFLDYNNENYAPQFRKISFNATVETSMGDNGKSKLFINL